MLLLEPTNMGHKNWKGLTPTQNAKKNGLSTGVIFPHVCSSQVEWKNFTPYFCATKKDPNLCVPWPTFTSSHWKPPPATLTPPRLPPRIPTISRNPSANPSAQWNLQEFKFCRCVIVLETPRLLSFRAIQGWWWKEKILKDEGNILLKVKHVGVSKNRDTPKSSILIGFSI